MGRIRADYVFGTTDAALTATDTTLSSPALSRLPAVTGSDVAAVTLYDGTNYEIVHVTAHTASATTATILRGQEGSTAQAWASGATWNHGPTAADLAGTTSGGSTEPSLAASAVTATSTAATAGDDFTGANGTALSAHQTNIGTPVSWTQHTGTFQISGDKLVPLSNTDGNLATFDATDLRTATVEAVIASRNNASGSAHAGVVFRLTDASNYYLMQPIVSVKRIDIYRVVGGVFTLILTLPAPALADNVPMTLRVDLRGPDITFFIDGQEQVTLTESYHLSATRAGVRLGTGGSGYAQASWDYLHVKPYQGTAINWPRLVSSAANPLVTKGTAGGWEDVDVLNPGVVWDPRNGRWVLYYSGFDGNATEDLGLGLAYSSSLNGPWTKEAANPVYTAADHINGGIVYVNGRWLQAHGDGTTIKFATSPDLITWTNLTTTFAATEAWESGVVFDAFLRVRQDGVTVEMWYAASTGTRKLNYATSVDGGLTWTKNPGPFLSPPAFAKGTLFAEPSVYVPPGKEGVEMLLFADYTDVADTTSSRRIACGATLDGGTTWKWWVAVLPGSGWESNQVFDSFPVVHDGRFHLFYAGAPAAGAALNLGGQIGLRSCEWTPLTLRVAGPGEA